VGRGIQVIPFLEDPVEDWYLIRRATLPERITYIDDQDREASITVMAKVYDVVMFDRSTGLLKVNSKNKHEELYRQAFSDFYFGDITFFRRDKIFTLESFRNPDIPAIKVPGIKSVDLNEVRYRIYEELEPTEYCKSRRNYYQTNLSQQAPVPKDANEIIHAKLAVHFEGRKDPHVVTVTNGNVLSYSRDDIARPVENFLREAGIMVNVPMLVSTHAA